jgi:FkbM family methyltransferase
MIVETDIEIYRRDTFWTKEPETIAWIESFEDGKTFFDVGANIGLYSLYAASLHPNLQIYAFEPMPSNFIRLLQNKELNGFTNLHCFNVAVGDDSRMIDLYIPKIDVGESGAQVDNNSDEHDETFHANSVEKVLQIELDSFHKCEYLKIDVDGKEKSVLNGFGKHLATRYIDPDSVLVECNPKQIAIETLIEYMSGLSYTSYNPFNHHPDHSRNRRGGDPENIVFTRKD